MSDDEEFYDNDNYNDTFDDDDGFFDKDDSMLIDVDNGVEEVIMVKDDPDAPEALEEMDLDPPTSSTSHSKNQSFYSQVLEQAQDDEDDSDAESDPDVVATYDVYFSQKLADELFIFQYPTRTTGFPERKELRVKPKSCAFEMDVPFPPRGSKNYNEQIGSEYGVALTDKQLKTVYDDFDPDEQSVYLEKQVYSSAVMPTNAVYLVGVIMPDRKEIHLTPIKSIVQMRPSFNYIDRIHEKEKIKQRKLQNIQEKEEGIEEDVGRVMQVTMKKAQKETKLEAAARLQKERDAEQWIPLNLEPPDSALAQEKCEQLLASSMSKISTVSTSKDYLDLIQPKIVSAMKTKSEKIVRGLQLNEILALQNDTTLPNGEFDENAAMVALGKQVRAILLNAQNVTFTQLKELLQPKLSDRLLIDAIKISAWLVNGQWIAKSELFYKGRMKDARDYALNIFQTQTYLKRDAFFEKTLLPIQMASNMLNEIASWEPGKGWSLKLEEDEEFMENFPDVVKQQKKELQILADEAYKRMTYSTAAKVTAKASSSSSFVPEVIKANSKGKQPATQPSASSSSSSLKAAPETGVLPIDKYPIIGNSANEQLKNLIRSLVSEDGVASKSWLVRMIGSRVNDKDAPDNMLGKITTAQIEQAIATECRQIKKVYVLKSLKQPNLDEFRPIVHTLFSAKDVVKKSDVIEACKRTLGKDMSSTIYSKIMKEIAEGKGPNWSLRFPKQ
ncbi:hypothetical protein HK098_000731 [Nowakowskiella sp. JEL0407]|nr:hypothetical protein HK098_000731 [Nowakowskiella sp. JEL0407]